MTTEMDKIWDGPDYESRARNAEVKLERLQAELEYAYRCIAHGYEFGTFDFSVLRTRAKEYLADKDGGIGPRRELLETVMFGTL